LFVFTRRKKIPTKLEIIFEISHHDNMIRKKMTFSKSDKTMVYKPFKD